MKYIKNANLVLENGILWDSILAIDGDRIAAYGKEGEIDIPAATDALSFEPAATDEAPVATDEPEATEETGSVG